MCRHCKTHVFFLVSSNKILEGASLARDCLIPVVSPQSLQRSRTPLLKGVGSKHLPCIQKHFFTDTTGAAGAGMGLAL